MNSFRAIRLNPPAMKDSLRVLARISTGWRWLAAAVASLLISAACEANTYTPTVFSDPPVSGGVNAGTGVITGGVGAGQVSLRSAAIAADANAGADAINLPAGTYTLTIDELPVGSAASSTVTLTGAGAATTLIRQTLANRRVIDVNPSVLAGVVVTIANVTITGGNSPSDNFGGGGLIGGGAGNTLTLSNCTIDSNSDVNALTAKGGGIEFAGGGVLNIDNCVISNNTAGSAAASRGVGGGVDFQLLNNAGAAGQGGLSITNSTFSTNRAGAPTSGAGGGLSVAVTTTQTPSSVTLTNNTFTGNQANATSNGHGGAITSSSSRPITLKFNRIVGNTVTGVGTGVYEVTGAIGTIDATLNWWGSNGGPGAAGSDTIGGAVANITTSPRLFLRHTPAASTILTGQATVLTASFLLDSAGGAVTAGNVSELIGLPIAFGSAVLGTLSSAQTTIQASGTATATFTAGATGGSGSANATVDNQTVAAAITINQAPAITSANNTTFTVGTAGTFTVTKTGFPTPTLSMTGTLPTGVTFVAGAGVLSGTPGAGTGGTYPLTFTASNGVGSNAVQNFTLTVNQAPAITSANNTTFTVGTAGTFTVTKTGFPTPTLSMSGALPSGVTFVAGTGVLSGTPAAGTGGTYPLTFTASNGVGSNATQNFTLTVNQAPAITSANATTFVVGSAGAFTVTRTGFPLPTLSVSGTLPSGVTFTPATGILGGTPGAGTGGTYPLTFTASNGVGSNAVQSFTLTVNQAPAITSANATTFTVGSAGTFTVTKTGFPAPTLSQTGALPSGVTFTPATGVLSGTPGPGTGGTYPVTFTASNGVGSNAVQSFSFTVNQAPALTSANTTTFTVGTSGMFTVTASGFPSPSLALTSGTLPSGVTFNPASGMLSGTPGNNTYGTYALVFTASNGVGSNAVQSFSLIVNPSAQDVKSKASITKEPAGGFRVTFVGNPGVQYTIQFAPTLPALPTLPNWQFFDFQIANPQATFFIIDTPPGGTTTRFYRALIP